ncbi:MAG: collagen-like protein, partial [Clostridia bacterium]|nr:collagen-like protein [Clostridia bacterium]
MKKILITILSLSFLACGLIACAKKSETSVGQKKVGWTVEDVYAYAAENGYEGTLADFLSSIKGNAGKDGADGTNGKDGVGISAVYLSEGKLIIKLTDGTETDLGNVIGAKGDKGDRGEQGLQGEKGDKGDKGDRGEQGLQGEKGDKGDDGRDAAHYGETHTVSFNVNGGTMPEGAETSVTVNYGDTLDLVI